MNNQNNSSTTKFSYFFDDFKSYWKNDAVSGFMVFLLALPLSLGIAKASGFPPAMGVLTAIIGGLVTVFFRVAPLTIKGPAAGLITISAAAMTEFGGGEKAWHIVATVVAVMAILQVITGLLKFGSLADLFPPSAVHGMLAAIGIIIILKQIPVLLGDEPALYSGEGPIELFLDIPEFVLHAHWHIAVVGLVGLLILFLFPKLKFPIAKSIPAPLVVLMIAVPLSIVWHFDRTEPAYSLVQIGDFWGSIGIQFDFSMIGSFVFWKYVFMFFFVSSLESLLTVKAIDGLDVKKRISNPNGDIIGQGAGNFVAGSLGGLPMISEVVRSSTNVNFQAQSKWSNFFHGIFLLLAMLLIIPLIEMIPNAALAAMLIYAGYNLTSPKHYIHAYHTGREQLVIFLVTIIVTLLEDLLLGIAAGILVKIVYELIQGVPIKAFFKNEYASIQKGDFTQINLKGAAVFTNLIAFKKLLEPAMKNGSVELIFSETRYIDHSFMAFVRYLERETSEDHLKLTGLDELKASAEHPESARKLIHHQS